MQLECSFMLGIFNGIFFYFSTTRFSSVEKRMKCQDKREYIAAIRLNYAAQDSFILFTVTNLATPFLYL